MNQTHISVVFLTGNKYTFQAFSCSHVSFVLVAADYSFHQISSLGFTQGMQRIFFPAFDCDPGLHAISDYPSRLQISSDSLAANPCLCKYHVSPAFIARSEMRTRISYFTQTAFEFNFGTQDWEQKASGA